MPHKGSTVQSSGSTRFHIIEGSVFGEFSCVPSSLWLLRFSHGIFCRLYKFRNFNINIFLKFEGSSVFKIVGLFCSSPAPWLQKAPPSNSMEKLVDASFRRHI